ncbi:MAG: hypothetical protein FWC99_07205, partial [Coriobacteriia bacterium]|nr:hypothetical protein [Coriobacteriia bacterium]
MRQYILSEEIGDEMRAKIGRWYAASKSVDGKFSWKKKLLITLAATLIVGLPVFAVATFGDLQNISQPFGPNQATATQATPMTAEEGAAFVGRSGDGTYVTQLSSAAFHSLALRSDGTIWGWGSNWAGQMGQGFRSLGNLTAFIVPEQIGTSSNWVYVHAGGQSSFAINEAGELWAWGHNLHGLLGTGSSAPRVYFPERVGTSTDWVSVTGHELHRVGIKADGTLWSWGNGDFGRHGNGSIQHESLPRQEVTYSANWAMVAPGRDHVMAIQADGTLWGWGNPTNGRLGTLEPTTTTNSQRIPLQIGTSDQWVYVASGRDHSVGIKADGTLWTWGQRGPWHAQGTPYEHILEPTQIGTSDQWVTASIGDRHVLAVRTDGTLWSWGDGHDGKLGHGNQTTQRNAPVQVGTRTDWASVA